LRTIVDFLLQNSSLERVRFVLFNQSMLDIFVLALGEIVKTSSDLS
jgi:hypothetical protein